MGAESGRVRTPRGVCVMGRIRGPSDDARRKSDDGPVVGVDRDTRKKTRVRSWLHALRCAENTDLGKRGVLRLGNSLYYLDTT